MTAVVNNLEAKISFNDCIESHFSQLNNSYDFDDMQLCHQIDEEEVLDIDESVTILELRWEPNRLC